MVKILIAFVFVLGSVGLVGQSKYSITGIVTNQHNLPLEYANVLIKETGQGATTNAAGYFTIEVTKGLYTLVISHISMERYERPIPVFRNIDLIFTLQPATIEMEELIKTARPDDYRIKSAPGIERMNFEDLEDVPMLLGEMDVVNSLTLLPGVSTLGEGASGFNVRGGKTDQNLITLNRAEIFNSSHLLGFFSIFNSDVVQGFTLYKGHLPAQYGGRISSVLNVTLKEGDYQYWNGSATGGFATSKLFVEGPLIENKLSFIAAGRIAYPNWMVRRVSDFDVKNSEVAFNDQNFSLGYRWNDSNKLKLTFYRSSDLFQFSDDFEFAWSHMIGGLTVQNSLNDNLYHELSLEAVDFDNRLGDYTQAYDVNTGVQTLLANDYITYSGISNHELIAGVEFKYYQQKPERRLPFSTSRFTPLTVQKDEGYVLSGYINDDWNIPNGPTLSMGLRYNFYQQTGDKNVYLYEEGQELDEVNIVDQIDVSGNMQSYANLEPRVGLNYPFSEQFTIKASYNRLYQYLHLISNTTTATPVDQWQLSTRYLKPQSSSNYSIGATYLGARKIWQHTVDFFYRDIDNIYDYKDFADLLLNDHIETELIEGRSKAYGVEVLIEKKLIGWTGWLAYTYSRSLNLVDGNFPSEIINNGDWYPSNYDQPHIVNLVLTTDYGRNAFWSFNFLYKSGRPFTGVESNYLYEDIVVPLFSERNNFRIPDYIRLDITTGLNSIVRAWDDKLTLSVYNVFGRRNVYSIYYRKAVERSIVPNAYQLSVLGRAFPSLTYTVNFTNRRSDL